MIIRWLQSIVGTKRSQNGHYPEPINTHSLIDVAHEVLYKEALEKKNALKDFEKYGWLFGQQESFRQRVREKVRRFLKFRRFQTDPVEELVEEVTERITEAAQADPYYKKLFDGPEKD